MLDFSSILKKNIQEKELTTPNINHINEKSLNSSNISDTSPVYLFCTNKNEINSKNENGWTPIYRSIIANNLIALNELLKLGSDPNITNNLNETPLYLCVDIDNYDALIILLQYNADANIAKKNGNTPLHIATKKKKDNFIHALLRNKANPNIINKLYSQTATHIAIINKISEEMLYIFHEYNADIYNIKDKYDKTPFDYAKGLKDEEYLNLIIKIFGEETKSKESKTLIIKKNPERKNDDKIIDIPKNFYNSNYNIYPENIKNFQYDEKSELKEEIKIEDNFNNSIIHNDKNTRIVGGLSFRDILYSDRTNYSLTNKSKKEDINFEKNNNILSNNNHLSEFKPTINIEQNEIKNKNSLIKNVKNNINIDIKMLNNS